MRILLFLTLIFFAACTATELPVPQNLTFFENTTTQENVSENITINPSVSALEESTPYLTENQQLRILKGQFNFSILTTENCEFFITTFHKNITETKEDLTTLKGTISRQETRIDTLLEQLGQAPPGTNTWEKIKDNYDQEQLEYDGLITQRKLLEKRLPDMDYTLEEMKTDCKRLKAQPLNRP